MSDNEFSPDFDHTTPICEEPGNAAFFGRNVLAGLVSGINDFAQVRQSRWERRGRWSMGVGLLGSAMWIDDDELIDQLRRLPGACVVVTKQPSTRARLAQLGRLEELNSQTPGLRVAAFPGLGGIARRVEGRPRIVGPYDQVGDEFIPTIRTLGFRRRGGPLVPIMHAKLALLGEFWWFDEGPVGPEEVFGFTPKRLWISSANFTNASRRSLEFGYWTESEDLMGGAYRFLLAAIRSSESVNPQADGLDPEFAPVEYDDDAMREAVAAMEDSEEPIDE